MNFDDTLAIITKLQELRSELSAGGFDAPSFEGLTKVIGELIELSGKKCDVQSLVETLQQENQALKQQLKESLLP